MGGTDGVDFNDWIEGRMKGAMTRKEVRKVND